MAKASKKTATPRLKVEQVSVAKLKSDPRNARLHNDRNIEAIEASLSRYGQQKPIVVRRKDNVVLAGNGTLKAAVSLGWKSISVVYTDLDGPEAHAFAIADNRTSELAEWDAEALTISFKDILAAEIPLLDIGFLNSEIDQYLKPERPNDDVAPIDRAEALLKKWNVKRGQLWQIGKHRLLCGDAADAADVARVIGGARPNLMVTDPPYGVGNKTTKKADYASYDDTEQNVIDIVIPVIKESLKIVSIAAVTTGGKNMWHYPRPTHTGCFMSPSGVGRSSWGFVCWQPILFYGKDPYLTNGMGLRPDSTSMMVGPDDLDHPCPKPTEPWRWLIERVSVKNSDEIYDPFLGSGTTMVIAEQLGRTCFGIEIEPKYAAVVLERLSLMGLKPKVE